MGIFIKIELIEMNYRIKRLFDKVDKYAEKASAFCLWNFCSANLLGSFFDPISELKLRHQEQGLDVWLQRCSRWQMWSLIQIRPGARCCGFRRSLPLHEMTLPRESRRQRRLHLRGFEVHWDQ